MRAEVAAKRPMRVVSSIDARRMVQRLVDIHEVDENLEPTVELPVNDEWFESVKLDARDQSVTCPLRARGRR
jgi:hypothetical protein